MIKNDITLTLADLQDVTKVLIQLRNTVEEKATTPQEFIDVALLNAWIKNFVLKLEKHRGKPGNKPIKMSLGTAEFYRICETIDSLKPDIPPWLLHIFQYEIRDKINQYWLQEQRKGRRQTA